MECRMLRMGNRRRVLDSTKPLLRKAEYIKVAHGFYQTRDEYI